jgi:hypothetical protein
MAWGECVDGVLWKTIPIIRGQEESRILESRFRISFYWLDVRGHATSSECDISVSLEEAEVRVARLA